MSRRILFSQFALLSAVTLFLPVIVTMPAAADTFEWTDPNDGDFDVAGNWTVTGDIGAPPPNVGDTATFNEIGTYEVTFNADEASDMLNVDAGDITFRSNGIDRTYNITTGAADVSIDGGNLTLGVAGDPLGLNIGDRLDVVGGSTFSVLHGSDVTAAGLFVGNSAGAGTLLVDGVGSTVTTGVSFQFWGRSGNTANVTFRNGATGSLAGIELARDSIGGTTGTFRVESGATVTTGPLLIADLGGAMTSATITVDGGASSLTQNGTSTLAVGQFAEGTATIDIQNGGTFNTGTGLTTVNATGTINVGVGASGTFNANGNITVDGGTITRGGFSNSFNLASGLTLTATNDAQINFGGNYQINQGTTFDIQSGADFSTTSFLDIGGIGGDGTLLVDGAGSSVTMSGDSFWGDVGNTADVTFRNGASGNLGSIQLARSSTGGTTGIFNIESGATVTTDSLLVANSGGATTSGTIAVDGAVSSLTQNGDSTLTVGLLINGTATIDIQNGGTFTTGTGLTRIETTGTLNVNTAGTFNALGNINLDGTINLVGGTLSAVDLVFTGSTFSFPFGTLELNSHQMLDAARLTELNVPTLTAGKTFRVGGTATLLTPLVLAGGTFGTDSLVNPFFLDFQTGTFELTGDNLVIGPAGLFGAPLALASGQTISVTNTATVEAGAALVIESGGAFSAGTLANDGNVILNGPAAALGGTTLSNNSGGIVRGEGTIQAAFNNNSGSEIRAEAGKTLLLTAAPGANGGQINLQGGTLQFSQALTNGSGGNILGRGTLIVGGAGLTNTGDLALSNGQTDVFGDVDNQTTGQVIISGNADVTFWDDVTHTGTLFNVSTGSSVTFFGSAGFGITGDLGEVFFEADITPGSSPGLEVFEGNVHFGIAANLQIELAGTDKGSEYDSLEIDHTASLSGGLSVSLLGGFTPSLGDTFEILTATGGVTGTFTAESLPDLGSLLALQIFYDANKVTLSIVPSLPGDYNADGTVNAADYTTWRDHLGQTGAGLAADGDLSGIVDAADYAVWKTNFGMTAPAALATSQAANVPEPSCLALAVAALLLLSNRALRSSPFAAAPMRRDDRSA